MSTQPATAIGGSEPRLLPQADPIVSLPVLVLFPHSRCNCKCLMCDIWRSPARDEISAADVLSWRDDLRRLGVRRVMLSGGEPLMHTHLWELCDLLRADGIQITLLSTGLLLRKHAAAVARGIDDVVVSLDGPVEVHNAIRRIDRAYELLVEGVTAARAQGATTLTGRCTVQRLNFQHLRATVAAARAAGLSQISFLAADTGSEAFNRPGGWDGERAGEVALAPEDLPALAAEIDALERDCADDFAAGFIAESPTKLRRRLYGYFAAVNGQGEFVAEPCNAPWVSSVIEADGTVRPCFFHAPLGRLERGGSLERVLNSPAALSFRRSLDTTTDPTCRRCVCTLALREPS